MKNILLILAAVVIVAAGAYWFLGQKETEPISLQNSEEQISDDERVMESVATMETGEYTADPEESSITWRAGKPAIAGYVHTGEFKLDTGSVVLDDASLTGEFVIDMNSLRILSLGGGKEGQESTLEGHLKSDRFFGVEEYPTATFKITSISPEILPGPEQQEYTASGELTMHGQTNEISFPAEVVVDENGVVWLYADLEMDRTKWGITFGSASVADKITDQIIGDTVTIDLDLKLEKN